VSKSELREAVQRDANIIGLRASARKHGVNEDTACVWAHRERWKLPTVFHPPRPARKRSVAIVNGVASALDQSVKELGKDAQLYLAATSVKASEAYARKSGDELVKGTTPMGIAMIAKASDTVFGWTAERAKPAQVNVAVVMPTPEQDAERQAAHDALDAITAKLLAE
jgi:hypothetical protein